MKTTTLVSAVVLACAVASSAPAMSGGTAAYQGALFNGDSTKRLDSVYNGGPRIFSVGAYVDQQSRAMTAKGGGMDADWDVTHVMAYVGCDLMSWLTVQGGAGRTTLDAGAGKRDSGFEWLAGGQVRLLDHFSLEPMYGEDPFWYSLLGDVQYTGSQSDGAGGEIKWTEFFSSVTLNITVRPERWGFMDRITVFAGPAYSTIQSTQSGGGDMNEDESFGFVGGILFNPSDNVSLKFEVKNFDKTSFGAGLGYHF